MDALINVFSLLGSLALFLYGMKIMSEGLEKFAGERLRAILAAMTKNRVMGVFTGIFITALIQSSSATTVMVVSFVNAGLMSLVQSIGVIMGANIGTTVTAWIISAIGFKVNIAAFAIPLLAIGMPLIFSGNSKRKSIGEFVFGFSFLFMGLSFLQNSATELNMGEMVASMLATLPVDSFGTILLFVLVGAVVTMIVQASAATMAITLMLFDMHIPGFGFEQAAALAMGQNIGTTITAFMASLTANTQARRAALAHMFFNVFGVVAVLCVFYPACDAVRWFVTDVLHIKSNDLFLLSAFHTAFNVLNTLILIWFVKQIERFVCRVLPEKGTDENLPRLKYISAGLLSTAELSLLEARKEIALMGQRCQRAFDLVVSMHGIEKDDDFNAIFKKVEKYEGITDNMEYEIAHYLQQVADGHLSDEAKRQIQRMLREVDDLESVGDCCYNLARTLSRKRTKCKEHFTQEQMIHISEMEQLVKLSLMQMIETLEMPEGEGHDISKSYETEREINALRTSLRDNNLLQISAGVYDYDLGAFYIDLVNGMEKLGDHVLNVVQAKARQKV
ncbi:MAG: Na/Pi cotransporter family protein [bacterium]|nr:Na/Pi cotransporter family protein [bacterium]MDD6902143.1 Na/Pi cotransporter family protein [bacterium]